MSGFGLNYTKIMHKKSLLLILASILFSFVSAQQTEDILFTIDDSPVYMSEFKRVYLKNIDLVKDESQKDVDKYLDLFINYKLKLKEAKQLGLDKKDVYLRELEGYKKQLSKGYLTDTQTSETLIKEAYDRSLERINASHILINVKSNASAKDTLEAYTKIKEIKSKIDKGEPFEMLAKTYSQDPSVVQNGGNLGWFSAFRMVYPFENAAYNTKKGEVSEPFRTQFGYHIVKVNDKEKKLGEVTVAHIMVAVNDNRTPEEAETRIKEIEQQLNQGVSFPSLAKQYSDDPSTALEGGKIRRFAQGALNSKKFEETAFGLKERGQLSGLVQTKFGWHIIQLIEKHTPKTFEEQKDELTKKVERDSRSKLVTSSFIVSLKKKYGVKKNEEALAYFKGLITNEFFENRASILNGEQLNQELFTLKTKKFLYKDFADFLSRNKGRSIPTEGIEFYVNEMYAKFESKALLTYYEQHLEEDNSDFANVIEEYRDGLLLFDLMESKIWNVSKTDSIGLRKFYEAQKDKYRQDEMYKVVRASSSKHEAIDKVKQLLLKKKSVDEIRREINTENAVVFFSEEELIKGDDNLPKNFSGKKGKMTITEEENLRTLIMVKEILPSRIKTFEETKGAVINDFQENIENKWLDSLKGKYSVKVNEKTLKRAKKELSI